MNADRINKTTPVLRARMPRPKPRDDARTTPTAWTGQRQIGYRDYSKASSAFQPDRVDDLFQYPHRGRSIDGDPIELITVSSATAPATTRQQFTARKGERSLSADRYAKDLRDRGHKVLWERTPLGSTADLAQVRQRLQSIHQNIPAEPNLDKCTGIPGYMLRRPCKHCPFAPTADRINFHSRQRAEEIAGTAYMYGFPCHESAEQDEDGGYAFGPNTQHCAGATMMFLADGHGRWPGIGNDRQLATKLLNAMDWDAEYYATEELFLRANTGKGDRR